MQDRRCLFISTCNADRRPWNGVPFEFLEVLRQIETSTILTPQGRGSVANSDPLTPTLLRELRLRTKRSLREKLVGGYEPLMKKTKLTGDCDLLFYVCQFLEEVQEIEQIEGWRDRAGTAVIFVLESWTSTFDDYPREMRVLSKFDHVFVLNGSCVEKLQARISPPVSQLNTATDCLRAAPSHPRPARAIDLLCIGRTDPVQHAQLQNAATAMGLFYHHDIWKKSWTDDWAAVRRQNAEMIKRSKYFLVWAPAAWHQKWRDRTGQDNALSTRYFEGAAGGAVILGTRPECPEFDAAFDWPDAIIPLTDDPRALLSALDRDPLRVFRARHANVTQCLRRHDWAHRWAQVLSTLGLQPTAAHTQRLTALSELSRGIDFIPARHGLKLERGLR